MYDPSPAPPTAAGNPNVNPMSMGSTSAAKHNAEVLKKAPDATADSDYEASFALHKVTPLLYSDILSKKTGHDIYLKLDALQPSGSFKIRGVGRTVALAHKRFGPCAHIVTSSGGNAGLAAATACKMLGLKCTIFVPVSTEDSVVALLRNLGAEVVVGGDSWDGADAPARALVESEHGAQYIHPFIGDDLVKGHGSIVHEIYDQLEEAKPGVQLQPDVIACTVGGGGLIQGIIQAISEKVTNSNGRLTPPKVVATQDFGADSFSQSMNLWLSDPINNPEAHVTLPAITSKATSMGTKKCSPISLRAARAYAVSGICDHNAEGASSNLYQAKASTAAEQAPKYLSTVIQSDSLAGSSCWQFKRDHNLMVELSCGAALSLAYHSDRLLPAVLATFQEPKKRKTIVIVVCGGSKVDQNMLDGYEREYGDMQGKGEASVDGKPV